MADTLTRWLKQHAAGEKLLAKVLRKYFRAQGERVVAKVRDLGLSLDVAEKAIDLSDEHAKLQEVVAGPLIGFLATGAENVLAQAKKPKSTKAFDSNALKNFDLPQWMKDEVEKAFNDLEGQSYWQDIQKSTLFSVSDAVRDAIEQGYSMDQAAEALQELFKSFSDFRAMAIARTETTGAYNRGHQAGYDYLHESGDIAGKEWLAVVDDDTRSTHEEADGQKVAANEDFSVGGESAPYPGAPSLSARNRVNCRCTTAATF